MTRRIGRKRSGNRWEVEILHLLSSISKYLEYYAGEQAWSFIRIEHDLAIIFSTNERLWIMCRIVPDDFSKYFEDVV